MFVIPANRLCLLTLCGLLLGTPFFALAQGSVPVVSSVPLAEPTAQSGAVVVFDSVGDVYRYGRAGDDNNEVYGVVSDRPPLYLETATATVPIVRDGVSRVAVRDNNGPIGRGDLLRLSSETGVAERSTDPDDEVFAVALETAPFGDGALVLADVSPARAAALRDAQVAAEDSDLAEEGGMTAGAIAATTARIVVALGIAVGSLAFILYTYRSIWVTGVRAVGRNPRARSAVLVMNIASSVVILFLAAFVVVVALGVLVVSI